MDPSAHTATSTGRLKRAIVQSVAVVLVTGVLLAAAAWAIFSAAGGDATRRLVAFCFLTIGAILIVAPFLTGRRFDLVSMCRWGSAIDTGGIALIVTTALAPEETGVSWVDGLQCYLVMACFGLAQMAAAWSILRWRGSPGLAIGKAVAAACFALTSLLWGHLLAAPFRPESTGDAAALAVVSYVNPLLAANEAIAPPARFDWPHHGRMYERYGIVGEARAWPLPTWWRAALAYLLVGGVVAAVGLARRRRQETAAAN